MSDKYLFRVKQLLRMGVLPEQLTYFNKKIVEKAIKELKETHK